MGIKIQRAKPRNLFASVFYRFLKLPIPKKAKFKLFLNLDWIFNRLSHEMSFQIYDKENHPWRRRSHEFILDFIRSEHAVLDLGCADGEITHVIAGKAKSVVGIDYVQKLIETAQNTYTKANLSFFCKDAIVYLTDTDQRFDVLILSHILEHLDEPKEFLDKFKCFFKYIYVEVPDFDSSMLNHYRKDLDLPLVHSDNDHVFEFDRHELQSIFYECNLKVINSEFIFGVQRYWCEVI